MVGSSFELLSDHVDWCLGADGAPAAAAFREIVEATKVLSFRMARRRSFNPARTLATMTGAWEQAMDSLGRIL